MRKQRPSLPGTPIRVATIMAADQNAANDIHPITRIMLRPIGSALPIGFYAFGIGIILMSAVELRWIPQADAPNIPMVLFGFVAPLEFLACIFAFLARDTASATTLGIFALSWIAQGLVMVRQGLQPSSTVGIFLVMIAAILTALAIIAYATKPLLTFILVLAILRSITACVVEFGHAEWGMPTAYIGIALTVMSLYGGTAFLIEDLKHGEVLPLFRRGKAEKAMEGGLDEQIKEVPNEPGVRQQL